MKSVEYSDMMDTTISRTSLQIQQWVHGQDVYVREQCDGKKVAVSYLERFNYFDDNDSATIQRNIMNLVDSYNHVITVASKVFDYLYIDENTLTVDADGKYKSFAKMPFSSNELLQEIIDMGMFQPFYGYTRNDEIVVVSGHHRLKVLHDMRSSDIANTKQFICLILNNARRFSETVTLPECMFHEFFNSGLSVISINNCYVSCNIDNVADLWFILKLHAREFCYLLENRYDLIESLNIKPPDIINRDKIYN